MKLQIFHTVNCGLYIWNGKSGLFIDGLHAGKSLGFSDTPARYIRMMEEGFFKNPTDLLFTHAHEDHYDPKLANTFRQFYPESLIYGSGLDRNNVQTVVLEPEIELIKIRDYTIYGFATRHDGKKYEEVPHRSYLIQSEGCGIWISADAVLTPLLADKVMEVAPDGQVCAAFAMAYQIGSENGCGFFKRLSLNRIFLYHLPYEADDFLGFRQMARGLIRRCERNRLFVTALEPDRFVEW